MEVGLVGLGKMGHALALSMRDHGYRVQAYSRSPKKAAELSVDGLEVTAEIEVFTGAFSSRKVIWLMVPAGEPVDKMIGQLIPFLVQGDIIVDGGNSHYQDSMRRAAELQQHGFEFVDAGISGGPEGARHGACMMIGATVDTFTYLEPLFKALCLKDGYLHIGDNGTGHYVKMVHNGIEYGMLQAIAEGFELMKSGPFDLDFHTLAKLWNNGSVIRSWLVELTASLFAADPNLEQIKGVVGSSGTGLWTVEEALARKVPVPVISQALFARYRSEQEESFAAKLVAGLRREFGGHDIEKA